MKTYQVTVQSHLDKNWQQGAIVDLRTGFDATNHAVTSLRLSVVDQAELIGALGDLHGMGLHLLSVSKLDPPEEDPEPTPPPAPDRA